MTCHFLVGRPASPPHHAGFLSDRRWPYFSSSAGVRQVMSGFSFASPTPAAGTGGGGGFSFGAAAPAPATTPGPVQTPTAAAAATNTATKGVSFSFASPSPTFGATPASTATAGGGFTSPPASASAASTTGTAGATPAGVANPLLRNAGVTPGLSRGGVGGGGMSGASPASFLSPGIGSAASSGTSGGRVTFAEDSTGILGGAGLRRRRGGVGEKENVGINSSSNNNMNMNNMGVMPSSSVLGGGGVRKAPPKASLLSLSPMMGGDVTAAGATQTNSTKSGQDAVSAVRERSLLPAAHVAPYNPNPYASWVVVYGYANSAELTTVLNRFGTYGTILAHHGGMSGGIGGSDSSNGNWICLRYETALQAEKAICQNGTFLHGGNPSAGGAGGGDEPLLIVGVMRMDAGVARRLGLAGPEGGVAPPRTSMSGGRPLITSKTSKAVLSEEDILLGGSGSGGGSATLAAGRQGSVCDKVVDKVLGWISTW